jgi:type II secretory pathway component PulF
MPRFVYKAKKNLTEVTEGSIDAESQADAVSKLSVLGLFPVHIAPESGVAAMPSSRPRQARPKRVTQTDVLLFVKKMTTLTRARVEILSGLAIIHEQTENPVFRDVIQQLHAMAREGKSFSEALSRYPEYFSALFVHIIRAGEASGRLDAALEQINDFMSRDAAMRSRIRVALAYPSLLGGVGFLSVFVLMNFVVPRLRPLLEGLGRELPLTTRIVLQTSTLLNRSWPLVLLGVVGLVAACFHPRGKAFLSLALGQVVRRIPVLRQLMTSQQLVQFTRALVLLLKSGVPALTAFELAVPTMEDPRLREGLTKACRAVADGGGIAKSLNLYAQLPDFFVKMIAIGEESGRLVEVLEEILASYSQQIEADIAVVTALLEPLLILVIGVVLGGIVLSILLPTFQITQFVS